MYSAPTGGGKSLVAEVLLVRRLLRTRRLGLLVLPYVSICEEKHAQARGLGFRARALGYKV